MVNKKQLVKKLLQTIFDEFGSEGVSVDDVEEITQEMIEKTKSVKMTLEPQF